MILWDERWALSQKAEQQKEHRDEDQRGLGRREKNEAERQEYLQATALP